MPVQPCTTEDGDPGRQYGDEGKCYPCASADDCADAEAQAAEQGRAIEASDDSVEHSSERSTFTAVLAVEGAVTHHPDSRYIDVGAITWPELPITLRTTFTDIGNHDGAVAVGAITDIWRDPQPDGTVHLMGSGFFDESQEAIDAARMAATGVKSGISVDPSGGTIALMLLTEAGKPAQVDIFDEGSVNQFFAEGGRVVERYKKMRIRAATLLDIQALEKARVVEVSMNEPDSITAAVGTSPDNGVLALLASDDVDLGPNGTDHPHHLTLFQLGDGDPTEQDWNLQLPVTVTPWATATFNAASDERDTAKVLLVQTDGLADMRDGLLEQAGNPDQAFDGWIPHVTTAYGDDAPDPDNSLLEQPITLDRLVWMNNDEITELQVGEADGEMEDEEQSASALVAAAVQPHSTPVAPPGTDWDGNSAETSLPTGEDPSFYRPYYAYQAPDTSGTAKDHWHYIHHFVEGEGPDAAVGSASLEACVAILQLLNGARGVNLQVSGADRETVYDHVVKHMADGGMTDIPELKPEAEVAAAKDHTMTTQTTCEQFHEELEQATVAAGVTIPTVPAAHFDPLDFAEATPLTLDESGRVYGHVALANVCHVGKPNCVTMPKSRANLRYFHTGVVRLDDGTDLATGRITMKGGHANINASWQDAVSHYDNTTTTFADVVAWEDDHGLAVTGHVRSDVTDDMVHAFRGSTPSGDWRPLGNAPELINIHMVNSPGFPVYRTEGDRLVASIAASAAPARAHELTYHINDIKWHVDAAFETRELRQRVQPHREAVTERIIHRVRAN